MYCIHSVNALAMLCRCNDHVYDINTPKYIHTLTGISDV